jgi:hypothetical protein
MNQTPKDPTPTDLLDWLRLNDAPNWWIARPLGALISVLPALLPILDRKLRPSLFLAGFDFNQARGYRPGDRACHGSTNTAFAPPGPNPSQRPTLKRAPAPLYPPINHPYQIHTLSIRVPYAFHPPHLPPRLLNLTSRCAMWG